MYEIEDQYITPATKKDDFKSVAKALGCDDDKARFEAKLGKLAKAKTKAVK